MKITIELNDREAAKVGMVKSILKCNTQTALSLIIAACRRPAIESAITRFRLNEGDVAKADPPTGKAALPPTIDDADR